MSDEAAESGEEPAGDAPSNATDDESTAEGPTPYHDDLAGADELVGEWLPPACPHCGDPVQGVVSRGPMDHRATPCGCRVAPGALRE
ncbi:hypothetical protein [Salinilacihabitans rarus]|uniref:hypothetical protein n=1 Tax=Salinilacihabitans rarus TaxID=2961596 RepID=UPI0020C90921|nr:hypothetical protein [Salinilacihabitans rarus]